MKKIIVPIDFSETAKNALRYAILFAQDREARIETIHVIPPESQPVDGPIIVSNLSSKWIEEAETTFFSFIDTTISQLQTTHQLKDIPSVISRVEIGLPVSKILDIAEREKFDLIMVGTQGEHNKMDRLLGSVSTGLVKNSKIPILVVPEHSIYKTIEKVCIAVDLKESDSWEIFKTSELIQSELIELDLIHVYPENKLPQTAIDMQDLETFYERNKQDFKINYHLKESGNLNGTLIDFLTKEKSDLLVMLGPHLSGIKNWFLQSTSKNMTYQTKIPFLRMN